MVFFSNFIQRNPEKMYWYEKRAISTSEEKFEEFKGKSYYQKVVSLSMYLVIVRVKVYHIWMKKKMQEESVHGDAKDENENYVFIRAI